MNGILVVGDSMLDCYWEGSVERISPEAPVPVLRLGREWQRPGGAANVALNVATLEARPTLVTLLGDDAPGRTLADALERGGVELHAWRAPAWPTTRKIRAVCRRQQLLRVDVEEPAHADAGDIVAAMALDLLPSHRWIVLSDYAKGALGACGVLLRRARSRGLQTLVDPKGDDFARYRGAWLLKPNEAEARLAAGAWSDEDDFERRMAALREQVGVDHLLVTRGERGMALFSAQRRPLRLASQAREVYDLSGAGDTVIAALAAALSAGDTLDDALAFANHAAAVVVGKFGTASVTRREIERERAAA